ncbi:hypothetical protein BaRGS_00007945 [Batillaria attramentaria]|uniref:Uncharacterized protein n=1 Tax=Batillaria attramentaria TaxID=370345 RepID=A0ABD0LN52_9CAEN
METDVLSLARTAASATTKRELRVITADAFASKPFTGNPAAICPVPFDMELSKETMQDIAMEMSLAETAYVRPLTPSDNFKSGSRFGLRWFTPVMEVEICGHATLASAAVLFYGLGNESKAITFDTLSGELIVRRDGDSLSMDFPVGVTEPKSVSNTPGVREVAWCSSMRYLVVRLNDGMTRSEFEKWRCDIAAIERSLTGVQIVLVTTRGTPDQGYVDDQSVAYDFVSRCFAPWSGVPEDPVTGSAQCVLAHYWSLQLGKKEFYTRQCSKRGGDIRLRLDGDRVHITGKATLVLDGTITL